MQDQVATGALDGEGLIEVDGLGRIERDERAVRAVDVVGARLLLRRDDRLHRRRRREPGGHAELAPDAADPLLERGVDAQTHRGPSDLRRYRRAPMNMPFSAS